MLLGLTGRGEETLRLEWRQPANWSSFTEGNIACKTESLRFIEETLTELAQITLWGLT